MTTFTGPVHIRLSADAPTASSALPANPRGLLSIASGGGSSTFAMVTAAGGANVITLVSAEQNHFVRGFAKIYVEGTVALVPFYYAT